MYRRTRKYDAERLRRAQATRERNRVDGPAPHEAGVIRLELPYPLSANVYWRSRVIKSGGTWRAMTYVSSEAVEYKRQVAEIARAHGAERKPMAPRCRIG